MKNMLLAFQEVAIGYDQRNPLIAKINLSIPLSASIVLIGDVGSGKTTLLNSILGKTNILAGKLSKNEQVFGQGNRAVAFLPQRTPRIVPPLFRVVDLLTNTMGIHLFLPHQEYSERRYKVQQVSDNLGIQHLLQRRVMTLSGGEYQLVLIAQILMNEVRLLILDEPFNNLDRASKLQLVKTLKKVLVQYDVSLICVLHGDIECACDIFTHELRLTNTRPRQLILHLCPK